MSDLNKPEDVVGLEPVDVATKVDPLDPAAVPSTGLLSSDEKAEADAAAANFKPLPKNRILIRRFFRNKAATLGFVLLMLTIIFSLAVRFFSPYAIDFRDEENLMMPPMAGHWLGTDLSGRDVMTMLGHATSLSLLVGGLVGFLSPIIGVAYGCTMAYFGGWVEKIMLFLLETMIMAPAFLIVAIVMAGKSGGPMLLVAILVIFSWMQLARLVRGMTLSYVNLEYVKSAKYMGVPSWKIIQRHLVPNIASLTILNVTTGIWAAILSEISYSYIGVGIKLPNVSLGNMISQATESLDSAPWLFWAPIITLTLITGPLALINDGMRDAFDPNSNSVGGA